MDGRDISFIVLWISALLATVMIWMNWGAIPASIYTFLVVLILFNIGEIVYHSSRGKAK